MNNQGNGFGTVLHGFSISGFIWGETAKQFLFRSSKDSGAAPHLRGVPTVPKGDEVVPSDVPSASPANDAADATEPTAEAEAGQSEEDAEDDDAEKDEDVEKDEEDEEDGEDEKDEEDEEDEEDELPQVEIWNGYGDDEDLEDEEPSEPVVTVNETALQEKREQQEGGTCCFSGESKTDTCGTCYPMSIASYRSKCSMKTECGRCGGTWCASKCAIAAADPLKKCATAYPTGISSDPHCLKNQTTCRSCNGEWCRAGYKSNFVLVEGAHGREVPEYVPPEDETLGTCCYRGSSGSEDMCSACGDVATDSTCSKKSRCAGCGGTWCPGPRCVKSFKDKTKPCQSADPFHGIAKSDDFCSLNEKQCSNCKGAWCPIANITYSDGTKYDPSHPYVPDSDQRQEPEDPEEAAEAEEEVANDPGLDDLFPDGLAEPELP
eukprot:Skav214439  [mRNA]  locus=scaffold586:564698:565999:+ [translate_table: standard]